MVLESSLDTERSDVESGREGGVGSFHEPSTSRLSNAHGGSIPDRLRLCDLAIIMSDYAYIHTYDI